MKTRFFLISILIFTVFTASAQNELSEDSLNTKKPKRFAVIPMVNYNNTIGTIFGLIGQYYYKLDSKDTISPISSTGLIGLYTTNKSYGVMAFQRMYFDEDNWRVIAAIGSGNFNFQCWLGGATAGRFMDYDTKMNFAFMQVERRIYQKLYLGVNGMINKSKLGFDLPDRIPEELRNTTDQLNYLGYIVDLDKREHQMNPYGGYNIVFKNEFYRTWMNSSNNFQLFDLTYNHYFKIKNERNIFATRLKAAIANGDVPFQGQTVVGAGDDLRGYSNGKYRNNQLYAVQAEYRWRFYKKLGMVCFAGVASSVEKFDDIFSSQLLPGVGLGVRYMVIEKERINIGIDIAKGKGDWGLYFRIGEAFSL